MRYRAEMNDGPFLYRDGTQGRFPGGNRIRRSLFWREPAQYLFLDLLIPFCVGFRGKNFETQNDLGNMRENFRFRSSVYAGDIKQHEVRPERGESSQIKFPKDRTKIFTWLKPALIIANYHLQISGKFARWTGSIYNPDFLWGGAEARIVEWHK